MQRTVIGTYALVGPMRIVDLRPDLRAKAVSALAWVLDRIVAFYKIRRFSSDCIIRGKPEGNRHKIRRFSSECIIRRKPEGNRHKIIRKLEGNLFFSELKNQKLFLHFHKLFLYEKVRRILEGQKVFRRKSSLRILGLIAVV